MIATLRENHFHFGVWQWPFIEKSITDLYTHGEQNHLFVTDQKGGIGKVVNGGGWHGVKFSGQFDFTNPAATQWYVELNKPLTDMGLDFLKIDTYSTVPKARHLRRLRLRPPPPRLPQGRLPGHPGRRSPQPRFLPRPPQPHARQQPVPRHVDRRRQNLPGPASKTT